jgi:cytochrome c peroxidase
MEKERRRNRPIGVHLFRPGRSKNNTSHLFSLKWYDPLIAIGVIMLVVCTVFGPAAAKSNSGNYTDVELTNLELLGKYVFFDKISEPTRMACVTCHDPETGGTGGVSGVNLHQVAITGANPHTVGNLKPPTNAYASIIEPFHPCNHGGLNVPPLFLQDYCGGNFWNGRTEGKYPPEFPDGATKHIGEEVFYTTGGVLINDPDVSEYDEYFGPTADQALNPMPPPNFVEQNIERKAVCQHVASSKYAELYEQVWGEEIDCSNDEVTIKAPDVDEERAFDISFKRLMLAVCAWQASPDLNSFSSKRDIALANDFDGEFPLDDFTDQENYGHDLFYATRFSRLPNGKFANCAFCHSDNPVLPGPGDHDTGAEPFQLYSAQDYHNIGTPRNPEIPLTFDADGNPIDPDLGIAGHAGDPYPPGFFKTPSLRNVDKRKGEGFIKAYTHNGWFKSMESIVHFYNTADVAGTTAASFGVTRCPDDITTEKDALANNCWPEPAYGGGAIPFLVGDLGLTVEDEAAIVAYLKTLTDQHTAKAPIPYKR